MSDKVKVKCVSPDGKNRPGDTTYMSRGDVKSNPAWVQATPEPESKSDPDVRERMMAKAKPPLEERLADMPYRDGGKGLYGLTYSVADKVDQTPPGSSTDELTEFCLAHRQTTEELIDDCDD